jgi:hypothetical protein
MKSQTVRLADVFVIGPAMIAIGSRAGLSETERAFLIGTGFLTIIYNAANYFNAKDCQCAPVDSP